MPGMPVLQEHSPPRSSRARQRHDFYLLAAARGGGAVSCLLRVVDSVEGARAISEGFGSNPGSPPARLLIELGMPNSRSGVRTLSLSLDGAR
jgi:D-serine deaminase-like pyridoxal phosphate-dependent protein